MLIGWASVGSDAGTSVGQGVSVLLETNSSWLHDIERMWGIHTRLFLPLETFPFPFGRVWGYVWQTSMVV